MKRSKFSLSNYRLLSCDMGELVPIMTPLEVLPGDSIQMSTSLLIRLSPLLAPVMHPVHVKVHHWLVPHRLVWDDWEDFITGGADGNNASVFPTIEIDSTVGVEGGLADYLGYPTKAASSYFSSALPFRGFALIFNEWYRDQDLVSELTIDTTDGVDTTTNTDMQNVAWEKDYFTSARPWTQKGDDVTVPLSGEAPVLGIATNTGATYTSAATGHIDAAGSSPPAGSDWWSSAGAEPMFQGDNTTKIPAIYADLASATGASIADVRNAFAIQRYKEARARYGSRYSEYLRYLGVRSSDARLQRPEYLGGGRQVIQFSEVLATAETGSTVDVGDLKGHGIGAMRTNRFRRFVEEHGYIFTLLSVKPKTMYSQGIPRTFNRRTKEDFWQKELQHIGQQPILNKEVYEPHATPEGTFGYQDRYDEYRRTPSGISGEFRSSTLDFWHMARQFSSDPALNETFVKAVPTKRIHAVSSNDVLWIMANHSIQARRLVAKTGSSHIF